MRYTIKWTLRSVKDINRMTVHTYYGLTRAEAVHQASVCVQHGKEYSDEWYMSINIYPEDDE